MSTAEVKAAARAFVHDDLQRRTELLRRARRFGTAYGAIIGVTFAISTWAADGLALSGAHAAMPWLKLVLGALMCGFFCALAGWVTARFERWYLSLASWIAVGFFFSWLLIAVPLQFAPLIVGRLNPSWLPFIQVRSFTELSPRFAVAAGWLSIFVLLSAAVQIPFVEGAAFSARLFGMFAPFALGMAVIGLGGAVSDSLNNQPLRESIVAIDHAIQFVIDHKGQQVDAAQERASRAGSLRAVAAQVTAQRSLTITGYDPLLGEVDVLIQFEHALVRCTVVYSQPVFCKAAGN